MHTENYDLIIVGAGSGNMIPVPEMDTWRLAIVEPDKFGGTCLNRGCIPSKMLLYAADVAEMARHGANLGLIHTLERVDWQQLVGRVWKKIDPNRRGGGAIPPIAAARDGIRRPGAVRGAARPGNGRSPHHRAAHRPSAPGRGRWCPIFRDWRTSPYHTSDTIMRLETQPNSLLIVGGGYIGAEMAHFFGSLGTHVILTDHGGALIKRQDDEVAQAFTRVYQQRFDVLLHTRLRGVHPENGRIAAQLDVAGTPRTVPG